YATRGTRVVTAGADGDVLMSLRHALTRQGLSVSMAWDAKQAVDLFDGIRPEVVVLDLELPPRNGYELVVRLAGATPVPSVVLVYGDGDDTGAGFAAALAPGAPPRRPGPPRGLRAVAARPALGRSWTWRSPASPSSSARSPPAPPRPRTCSSPRSPPCSRRATPAPAPSASSTSATSSSAWPRRWGSRTRAASGCARCAAAAWPGGTCRSTACSTAAST